MEEILASIRRIIADDQVKAPDPEAPEPADAPEDDVLDLAEVAQPVRRPEPPPFEMPEIDFREEVAFEEPATGVPPSPPPAPPRQEPRPVDRFQAAIEQEAAERLVSQSTDASVNQAFGLLAHTVMSQNARTLEDLVKDMLRPMLKGWLDDNLPHMVERLVRAEIERVSRGH